MKTAPSRTSSKNLIAGWSLFAVVALAAWVILFRQSDEMSMAEMISAPAFVLMWVVMMAAMMFPSVAPVALMWTRSIGSSSTGAVRLVRTSVFAFGYLTVWAAFGAITYGGSAALSNISTGDPSLGKWLAASLFAVAGIYQLTPFKDRCLQHCRSPMSQLMDYAALKGAWRDLRVGAHHGLYCLGCCWGIMIVLLAVGTMNLLAAAVLAMVIFLEKLWVRGPTVAKVFGLVLIAVGILTLFYPMTAPALQM